MRLIELFKLILTMKKFLALIAILLLVGCEFEENVESISSTIEKVSAQNNTEIKFEYSSKNKLIVTVNDKRLVEDAFLLGKILLEIDQQLLKERIVIQNYLIRSKVDKKMFLNLNIDLLHQIRERKKKAEGYLKLYSQNPNKIINYLNKDLLKNKEILDFFKTVNEAKHWIKSEFNGFNIYPLNGTNYLFFEFVTNKESFQICLNSDNSDNDIYGLIIK